MKKILIISPHYPPSNLAAVHRSRLFAKHLPSFGWEPIILTVDEHYYEESLDWNLAKLIQERQRIEKVKAFPVTKPRVFGDIGLRAFFQLRRKALELVKTERIDFVYIPIPSFYVSLIGSFLNKETGVKYGIDYIDPWVHIFPGSEKIFSRHWFSTKLAELLEPMAVKNASLITGVAEGYYKGVQERNPHLIQSCVFGAMPYGGEEEDHLAVKYLGLKPYLFKKNNKVQLVYAGAMLPKAYTLLEAIFKSISENLHLFEQVEFHFIGTGKNSNNPEGFNIKPIAQQYGLWNTIVFEYPKRIPYLDVLIHLEAASSVFILGSTEPHYTPSKVFQAVLSRKPIFAVLHQKSTAAHIIKETNAGLLVTFLDTINADDFKTDFVQRFSELSTLVNSFKPECVNLDLFQQYKAINITSNLTQLINNITNTN